MARKNDNRDGLDIQGIFSKREGIKEVVELVIQGLLEAEAEAHVGAGLHERSRERRGYRNGHKTRTFATRVGKLDVSVPQVRDCDEGPYEPSLWNKWQRSEQALLATCAQMYFQGVSTRDVSKVLEELGGFSLSAGQVSRMAAHLDEQLSAFRSRNLAGQAYPFLILDARYEKIREQGLVVSRALLTTIGINELGRREILDWRVADSENEHSWADVLRDLKQRGLSGTVIVVSDAHQSIRKALARHLQGASWQRCRVHYKRAIMNRLRWQDRKRFSKELNTVFTAEDRQECLQRVTELSERWSRSYGWIKGALNPEELEACLTVNSLPNCHRYRLKSTNMLERVMQELKRRSRPVRIFPNAASCERLLGMHLMELHESWQVEDRPYLNMSPMANADYPIMPAPSGRPA